MNYLDLFHGIGGFALGAYWAGMKFDNHYCSDIEPYTQELYKLRFPDSIQLGDITKIKTEDLPAGDWILSGGFPCQDISIAGKGRGLKNEDGTITRSGLWFEYWRLIRDLRPGFAFMENVGMLTREGLLDVLGSLTEIGYNAEWQLLRACQFGLPHSRRRVWIIAYPESERYNREKPLFKKNGKELFGQLKSPCTGIWVDKKDRTQKRYFKGISYEPLICRKDDGISGELDRLKGLGNAIVPQIAELLFKRIKYLLESEPRKASQS